MMTATTTATTNKTVTITATVHSTDNVKGLSLARLPIFRDESHQINYVDMPYHTTTPYLLLRVSKVRKKIPTPWPLTRTMVNNKQKDKNVLLFIEFLPRLVFTEVRSLFNLS